MQSPAKQGALPVVNQINCDQGLSSNTPSLVGDTIEAFRRRFDLYTDSFGYKDNPALFPLKLKYDHSLRVTEDARSIAKDLGWTGVRLIAAEAAALFHDIGRFPQYRDYRTFFDSASIDHGEASFNTMVSENILENCGLEGVYSMAILDTVRYHNRKNPPENIPPESLAILNLVRDADKIDIIRVINDSVRKGWYENNPEILLGIDVNGPITQALVEEIRETRQASYDNVKSLADMHLVRMAWVFSINYPPSIKMMQDRHLLDVLSTLLPAENPDVKKIRAMAEEHIAEMLNK